MPTPAWVPVSSFVISLTALLIAWENVRRSHRALVKWTKVRAAGCGRHGENGGESFSIFALDLKNLGVPLHEVRVSLEFIGLDPEIGTCSLEFHRYDREFRRELSNDAEFSKGMIGRFGLKSYVITQSDDPLINHLHDCAKQMSEIVVTSQGYDVKRFRVGGRIESAKSVWNRFASMINYRFDKETFDSDGRPRFRSGKVLPTFQTISWQVMFFASQIRREIEKRKPTAEANKAI